MALPSWLRQLLLCALVVALPLQSMAATAMALCAWAVSEATAMDRTLAAPTADDPADCHAADATPSTADHHCNVCTVCALVGTPPGAPPAVPVVRGNLPPALAPAAKVATAPGDRLDRPPRARG
ncbi:MAG: hypothetical protein RJA10_2854 [Pseudomonadota bacterium]|jgi:hypothetical protein